MVNVHPVAADEHGNITDTKVLDKLTGLLGGGGGTPAITTEADVRDTYTTAPAGSVIDLGDQDITLSATLTIDKPVTFRNGTLRGNGARAVLVNAAGVTFEGMAFHSTGVELSAVSVRAENFLSINCEYTSEQSSALTFSHGVVNGATVRGGRCTTYSRRQNSAGIYVGAGNVGNYRLTFDGVTVEGGPDRGPDGIIIYDAHGSVVRGCTIKHLRALPEVTVTGWTLTATANTWVSAPVRDDGPTRALYLDGAEWTETAFAADKTRPSPKTWTTENNLVYINTANADGSGGFDPNTRTAVSRIVSGYALTMYCTPGDWRTMRDNLAANNHIEDVDGYGIYLQVGDTVATGNATDSNVLINTCLKGEQSTKLPFAAIGVVGGKQTTLSNDTIDGAAANGVKVSSDYDDPGNYSTGSISGLRVRNVTGNGMHIAGGNWQIVNTNVTECSTNGFHLFPEQSTGTVGVSLVNCEASYNSTHGLNATAGSGANFTVNIAGGFFRKNTSRGMNAHNVDHLTIGGGALFDGNPGYNLVITDGCVNVHLDGIVFQNASGVSVGNGITKLTTGRLIWGNNVSTKIAGTGAARVVDIFETPTATSPNGTLYKIAVADDGTISATAA